MSSFMLELDTTPPVADWQTALFDNADFTLRIPYSLNEPMIVSASVRDQAGSEWPADIQPDHLSVAFPDDYEWRYGTATVGVLDEVGNAAIYTLTVGDPPVVVRRQPVPATDNGWPKRYFSRFSQNLPANLT